jgi:hypothetical protein
MGTLGLAIIVVSILVALAALGGLIQFPSSTARLFASRVARTVGHIPLSNSGSTLNTIQVYVLGGANPPEWVGLTVQNGNFAASRPITPITLSIAEAMKLSELLTDATKRHDPPAVV